MGGFGDATRGVQGLEMNDNRWINKMDMQLNRIQHSSIVLDEKFIMLIGGEIDDRVSSSVIGFDTQSSKWMTMPPIPIKLQQHSSVAVRHDVFVLGGVDINPAPKSTVVLRFDTHANK